jgi:hypothetical protein
MKIWKVTKLIPKPYEKNDLKIIIWLIVCIHWVKNLQPQVTCAKINSKKKINLLTHTFLKKFAFLVLSQGIYAQQFMQVKNHELFQWRKKQGTDIWRILQNVSYGCPL